MESLSIFIFILLYFFFLITELILDIHPDVPLQAIGDPFRLRQILLNLVSNACKFTKEGHILLQASITTTATPSSSHQGGRFDLHVRVEDTGIGMSLAVGKQLFQPFTQADQSTRRQFGGTGLGLSIAQHLAHLMSGTIWFDSTEGTGSIFHADVVLGGRTGSEARAILPVFNLSNQKKLLVVIRNSTFRPLLAQRLTDWRFHVVAVGNSTEALRLEKEEFTLLVADINGRPDDRILLQTFHMVTILLRQGGEEERLKQALSVKTDKIILNKPVRMNELYQALQRAVNPFQPGLCPLLLLLLLLVSSCCQQQTQKKNNQKTNTNKQTISPDYFHIIVPAVEPVPRHERHCIRILLAEDNVTNQLIIGKMLRRIGQTNVTTVNNGHEAVETCFTTRFDLIFMDIMMPEMDGWDATLQIRALPGPRVFIVALTANVSSEDRKRCIEVGMDRVVTKPIQIKELTAAVDAAIQAYLMYHNSSADQSL